MTQFSETVRRRWESRPIGWLRRPRGATVVEYLVMLVLGVLILLGALQIFGGGVTHQLENATDYLAAVANKEDPRSSSSERGSSGRRDSQESTGVSSGSDDDDGGGAVYVDEEGRQADPIAGGEQEETKGSVGGVNPLVILLLIGGALFLGYIVFRND